MMLPVTMQSSDKKLISKEHDDFLRACIFYERKLRMPHITNAEMAVVLEAKNKAFDALISKFAR